MFDRFKKFLFGNTTSSLPPLARDDAWNDYLVGNGYTVSSNTALKIATVMRCVDVVAKTMSSLGCVLYKENKNERTKAKNHTLFNLLKNSPNPETTSYEFWHMYIFNLMLTTGAYAKIVRDRSGKIIELWNIPTSNVIMERNVETQEKYIRVYWNDENKTKIYNEIIYPENYMYTPGLRFVNSDKSDDFIKIASDVLGLSTDLSSYASNFFKNNSNLGGFVVYPGKINPTRFQQFKESWNEKYTAVQNAHKWAILEGGFDVKPFTSDPEKSQALESRKFQVIEICRMFGIPPHKVFSLETTNFASMEQSNIEYVQETINPMSVRLCQTIYLYLLNKAEKRNYYCKFNINHLLRGDMTARTAFYSMMRQNGIYTTNDILDLEDMNTISDQEGGNTRLVNGALIPLTEAMKKGEIKIEQN